MFIKCLQQIKKIVAFQLSVVTMWDPDIVFGTEADEEA
jgi:hypothetical protein